MSIDPCPADKTIPIFNLKANSEGEAIGNAKMEFGAPATAVCQIGDKFYLVNSTQYRRQTGQPKNEKEELIDKIEKGRLDYAFGLGKLNETKALLEKARQIQAKGDGPGAGLKFLAGVGASTFNFGIIVPAFQDIATGVQALLNKWTGSGNGIETTEALDEVLKENNCVQTGSPLSWKLKKMLIPGLGIAAGGGLLYGLHAKGDEKVTPNVVNVGDFLLPPQEGGNSTIPNRDNLEKMSPDDLKKVDLQLKGLMQSMTLEQEKAVEELQKLNATNLAKGLGTDGFAKDLLVPLELGLGFGIGNHYVTRWYNANKPWRNWLNDNVKSLGDNARAKAEEQFKELMKGRFLKCGEQTTKLEVQANSSQGVQAGTDNKDTTQSNSGWVPYDEWMKTVTQGGTAPIGTEDEYNAAKKELEELKRELELPRGAIPYADPESADKLTRARIGGLEAQIKEYEQIKGFYRAKADREVRQMLDGPRNQAMARQLSQIAEILGQDGFDDFMATDGIKKVTADVPQEVIAQVHANAPEKSYRDKLIEGNFKFGAAVFATAVAVEAAAAVLVVEGGGAVLAGTGATTTTTTTTAVPLIHMAGWTGVAANTNGLGYLAAAASIPIFFQLQNSKPTE